MLVLAREIHHLRHLGFGDLVGKHAALADSVMVDMEHDLGRGFDVLLEKPLQHVNDELHRRVIVVKNQHAIEVRSLGLGLDLGDDRCGGATWMAEAVIVLAHSGAGCGNGGRQGRSEFRSWMRHGTDVSISPREPDSDSATLCGAITASQTILAFRSDRGGQRKYGTVTGSLQARRNSLRVNLAEARSPTRWSIAG